MVTYGKTLGGGLPVGVVCGKARCMKRFRDDRPSDVCFARGTFNSHPYVMGGHERVPAPSRRPRRSARSYARPGRRSGTRGPRALNERLAARASRSAWRTWCRSGRCATRTPSRYNWMFQYYLRAEGLALSWVGTGRLIFSHNYTDADFAAVVERFVAAARRCATTAGGGTRRQLTNRAIKRQMLREMLAVRSSGERMQAAHAASSARSDRRARRAAHGSAPCGTASRRETGR